MNNQQFSVKTDVKPEELIGTKWIGWSNLVADRMSMEFLDRMNCIYTSGTKKFPLKYNLLGDSVTIDCLNDPFVIKGNVLFANNIPVFSKAA